MATLPRPKPATRGYLYITEWFDHLGASDSSVASKLDENRETVHRWRKEQHRLNPQKITRLEQALGLRPGAFWHRPGSQDPEALLALADDDLRATVADIIARLLKKPEKV